MSDAKELVLVSGASGYVAGHVIKQLQEAGYRVRGTVRSLKDEKKIKHLYGLCPNAKHELQLVEADLQQPDSWTEAVKGCTFIQHVASPLPTNHPKHDDEVIRPAVDGTLNVLKAAAASGTVKRVVLTSALVSIATKGGNQTPHSEKDWGDTTAPEVTVYSKSKILAEKAAWEFMKNLPENQKFELTVMNPGFIVGPALHGNMGASTDTISRLMKHDVPMCPKLNFSIIDVRDVALCHIKAMTLPDVVGYKIPLKQLPDGIFAFIGLFNKLIRSIRIMSSKPFLLDNSRMINVLGISPIDVNKTFIDMGYSLVETGIVPKTSKYRNPSSSLTKT